MIDVALQWAENPSKTLAGLLKANEGERWVYKTTCRCPHCHAYWVTEHAAPRGEVDPNPDPIRLGMALLCGRCEAKRRAIRATKVERRLRSVGYFWAVEDTNAAWGVLRGNSRGYRPRVERLGVWDGSPLRDDREAELVRILGPARQPTIHLTDETVRALGLDWAPTEESAAFDA
jgi:hypothetical protein